MPPCKSIHKIATYMLSSLPFRMGRVTCVWLDASPPLKIDMTVLLLASSRSVASIMPKFGIFEVCISVEGTELPEYSVTIDEQSRTVTCWIPSEVGKVRAKISSDIVWAAAFLSHILSVLGVQYQDQEYRDSPYITCLRPFH